MLTEQLINISSICLYFKRITDLTNYSLCIHWQVLDLLKVLIIGHMITHISS